MSITGVKRDLEEKLQICRLRGRDVPIPYGKCSSSDMPHLTEFTPVSTHLQIKINVNVYWTITPCSVVPVSRRFRRTCYLKIRLLAMKKWAVHSPERSVYITRIHHVSPQRTISFMFTAVRAPVVMLSNGSPLLH
jgi:hypothetical protein